MEVQVFEKLTSFNVTLLAKQGCRILNFSNSLLTRVLKSRNFPNSDFLTAELGRLPSYTWKSVWAIRALLQDNLYGRVANDRSISITDDSWVPEAKNHRLEMVSTTKNHGLVTDLIDEHTRVES